MHVAGDRLFLAARSYHPFYTMCQHATFHALEHPHTPHVFNIPSRHHAHSRPSRYVRMMTEVYLQSRCCSCPADHCGSPAAHPQLCIQRDDPNLSRVHARESQDELIVRPATTANRSASPSSHWRELSALSRLLLLEAGECRTLNGKEDRSKRRHKR